jgi:hypothetical protein
MVSYNDTEYIWDNATNEGIILDFIYNWNRSLQSYIITDTIIPGYGYWFYAFDSCDTYYEGLIQGEDNEYITTIPEEWSLIGIPDDTPLDKENITIYHNETEYTWQQAVDNDIILNFTYGWNAETQSYSTSDILNPGEGYWVYTFEACTLKK